MHSFQKAKQTLKVKKAKIDDLLSGQKWIMGPGHSIYPTIAQSQVIRPAPLLLDYDYDDGTMSAGKQ